MALSSLLILMGYLLTICSVQGLSHLELMNTTLNISCISASNAFVEYSQPAIASCFRSCASGPHYVEHYKPGYLYWPQIRFKSCDGLICGSKRRCNPTRSHRRHHIICVYKCGPTGCTFIGTRYALYIEHLDCQCECQQIEICSRGYEWNAKQCRCIKKDRCPPDLYYDYIFRKCLPHILI